METQTRNMLFKITFSKERRNESLSLVRNQKNAIWIHLKRGGVGRKVELCLKESLTKENMEEAEDLAVHMIPL